MVDPFGLGANLVTIISAFKDPKDLVNKIRSLNKRQKILGAILLVLLVGASCFVCADFSGALSGG